MISFIQKKTPSIRFFLHYNLASTQRFFPIGWKVATVFGRPTSATAQKRNWKRCARRSQPKPKLGDGPWVKQHCIHFGVIFVVSFLGVWGRIFLLGGGVFTGFENVWKLQLGKNTRHPFWSVFSSCKICHSITFRREAPGGEEACALPLFWKVPLRLIRNSKLKSQESCTPWKIN